MSGYHHGMPVPNCKHGRSLYERCHDCVDEREADRQAERARIREPGWVIEQAIQNRRRWFDGCAFCPRPAAWVVRFKHEPNCPFVVGLASAWLAYGTYLGAVPIRSTEQKL